MKNPERHRPGEKVEAFLFPHPAIWLAMAAMLAVQFVWLTVTPMDLDYGQSWQVDLLGVAFLLLGLRYVRVNPTLSIIVSTVAFFLLFGEPIRVLTYLGASAALPLQDANLAAVDRALGFDWLAHVKWINSMPVVAKVLEQIYLSIMPLTMTVLAGLVVLRRFERVREMILLFGSLGIVSTVLWTLLPAACARYYHAPDPALLSNLLPNAGQYHLADFFALRDGSMKVINFDHTAGIICFPSFHTITPLICIWSLRRTHFFWVALPVNLAMIVSTLSVGGHYLADVIAGAALFAVGAWLYRLWVGSRTADGSRSGRWKGWIEGPGTAPHCSRSPEQV